MRILLVGLVAACTAGAPPGFSGGVGDRWTFPLVGPLEDGLLLTPVSIGSHGPYLFAIDPDAPISVIDGSLVKEAELRTFNGPHRLDESDTQQPRIYAELVGLEIGSLIIERRDAIVVRPGTFDIAGRRVRGVIGRDVLADSLVFGFDRDRGLGYLMTVKAFRPPPDAIEIPYELLQSRVTNAVVPPPPRRLARAKIGAERVELAMHLDLGAVASQLREPLWERAKLVGRDVRTSAIDEIGTIRMIGRASEPTTVTVGGAVASGAGAVASDAVASSAAGAISARVVFVPYGDKRWDDADIAGTLGLGVFAAYDVWIDFDGKKLYAARRTRIPLAQRVARWETGALQSCDSPGCLTVRLVDPLAGKPPDEGKPHPGVVLSLTRESKAGGMSLEAVLEATFPGRADAPVLPRLIVNMPPNVDRLIDHLDDKWLGATLVIVDAGPFPRDCPGKAGCVDKLER